jgi:hypothetical protein
VDATTSSDYKMSACSLTWGFGGGRNPICSKRYVEYEIETLKKLRKLLKILTIQLEERSDRQDTSLGHE